jgi:hypothetical protein
MTWAQLLAAAEALHEDARNGLRDAAGENVRDAAAQPSLPIAGIGWATVDLERAQRELDGLLAGDPDAPPLLPWAPLERDATLGARACLRAPNVSGASPALVVLEPDTEGRLAASLVRFGEGVLVLYLGEGLPRPGELLPGRRAWGPNVVVLGSTKRHGR